jgi:micrococcal nuclease
VIDGDTVKVRTRSRRRITVRLLGIDAPEGYAPGAPVECGAAQASRHLRKLSFRRRRGRAVTLTTDATQDERDAYGRLLAYAKTDAGKVLQSEQLRAGWAAVYVFNDPFERIEAFRALEGEARIAGRGAWTLCAGDFHQPA